MTANGTRSITWAHGEDTFCLAKVETLLALEDKCNAGLGTIAKRLETGDWYVNDVRQPILLGLIGGGMKPEMAKKVMQDQVDGKPIAEFVLLAYEIVASAIVPPPGPQPGKEPADRATTEFASTTMTGDLSDPQSMASEPASAGTQDRQTPQPFGNLSPVLTDTTQLTAPIPIPNP